MVIVSAGSQRRAFNRLMTCAAIHGLRSAIGQLSQAPRVQQTRNAAYSTGLATPRVQPGSQTPARSSRLINAAFNRLATPRSTGLATPRVQRTHDAAAFERAPQTPRIQRAPQTPRGQQIATPRRRRQSQSSMPMPWG
jgi:hypothetical protein